MAQKHRWKRWTLAACAALISACASPSGGGAAPDFALTLSPAALTVAQGGSAQLGVSVERKNGFSGEVTLSLVAPPAGIGAPSVTIPAESASGSLTISVDASAALGTFGLTVRGQSSTLSRTAALEVTVVANGGQEEAPVIHAFSASPATIAPGESSTLSWSVTGASALRIDPGIGEVTGSSMTVSPGETTEYTLTASNAAGASTAKTTVTVEANGGGNAQSHAFFLPFVTNDQTIYNTEPARVAVDANGGVHVAYEVVTGYGEPSPVIYGYCPSDCTDESRFKTVPLGSDENAFELNLILDPQGRPRMLWDKYDGYRYAECDANCTVAAAWTLIAVPTRQIDIWGVSKRTLALDAQGRPRFVYTHHDWGNPAASGTHFVWCDADCLDAANWQEARISPYPLKRPMLVLTPAGLPRLAAYDSYQLDGKEQPLVVYLECNAGCGSEANWTETPLHPLNPNLGAFAMQLDGQGRPRLALYTGDLETELWLEPKALYYLWCDGACSSGSSWQGYRLPFGEQGMYLDLALDGQGRPRLAFDGAGSGAIYAWCDADCEATAASWQSRAFDSGSEIDKSWPIEPSPGCSFAAWLLSDYTLALDGTGSARIGYEARHSEVCGGSVHTNYRLARFASLRSQ